MEPENKLALPTPSVPQLPRDRALLPTLAPVQTLHHAVASIVQGGSRWTDYEGESPPSFSKSIGGGMVTVAISPAETEFNQSALPLLWQMAKSISWRTLIVAQALLAQWTTLATSTDQAVIISVDRILDYRGLRRIHQKGEPDHWLHGHRGDERYEVARELHLLQNVVFSAVNVNGYTGGKRGKCRKFTFHNSRFIAVTDVWGQLNIDAKDDSQYPAQIRYVLGNWVKEYSDNGIKQLGKILDRNLSYDYYHECWELALASWLTLEVFPNNAGRNRPIHRAVETVLDAIGQFIDQRHPKRTRCRLEKALNRMVADGYLSSWEYVGGLDTDLREVNLSTFLKTKTLLVPAAIFEAYYAERCSQHKPIGKGLA